LEGEAELTGQPSAAEAAPRLGAEIVRFGRLIAALKQRLKHEPGGGDRIILARLMAGGERRATDLAAETFLDLSTVSRQVRSLVERGLVERRPDPDDGRGALLAVTPAGQAAFDDYRRQQDKELGVLLEDWSSSDRAELIRLLARLNDDLTERYTSMTVVTASPAPNGHREESA
jgi:DNA-binding MarR family transcriptional regulator